MKLSIVLLASLTVFAAGKEDFDAHKKQAFELLRREDFRAALVEAQAAQKARPDDIESYRLTAEAHLGLGDYDAAEKSIQWMLDLRIGKADAQGWLLVARFREVTGDIEGALDAVNLAYARLDASETKLGPELLAYAGHLHLIAGRLKVAEQAVGSQPCETLARIRLQQGRREEAVAILQGLEDPKARQLLAELTGNYEAVDKNSAAFVLYLAVSSAGRSPAEALALAQKLAARRQDVFTLDALAMSQFAMGDLAGAQATMRKVIAVGSRDPRILAHIAQLGLSQTQSSFAP
jgi:tetratricopeptide (TPR) repeat protein